MKKYSIYSILFATGILIQSCFVAKDYSRPQTEAVDEKLFRTDALPQDSLSMADLSWKEIFTDSKLTQHIEKGLQNNLDIRIALENINSAEAYLKMGKQGYLPTLDLSASYTRSTSSTNTQLGGLFGNRQYINTFDLSGSLNWEADVWGKIRSNKRAYAASYLQSVAAHQTVKSEIVSSIASLYYQLLSLDEQKRIIEETISNRESSLETTKALKEAGNVTEVAVKQTEAQLINAKAQLVDTEYSIKLLENSFCILLGEIPHDVERTQLEEQKITTSLKTGVPAKLLENRPDVMAAEYSLINAFELTNVARASFYPSFTITGSGGLQAMEIKDLFDAHSLFGSFIAGLAQPILNGRQIRTQYEVSKANKESALLNYHKTILNAGKDVSDALFNYENATQKISLKEEESKALEEAMDYSEELLAYGMANYLEVLTAKESALNAQLSVINAKYAQLTSIVQLYKALGGGWK